jgi:hypothetical protein
MVETRIGARLLHGFALICKRHRDLEPNMLHILKPSAAWRPMLSLSLVVRVAGGPHNDYCKPADDRLLREVPWGTNPTPTLVIS